MDVGGAIGSIGLKVFVPEPTSLQHNIGSELSLHTYLQVREDALILFGFASEDELSMFELLIGVSGVGFEDGNVSVECIVNRCIAIITHK